eukprot:TRINITY_DN3091_c0_g1_i1.p1 TRINITY_DN3091_c0_g1~~TRINITY_DN3091_c0_g1_i1.p1  ORF type:complete len:298 (-),score=39.55 TRINITY_DN3091_c0_g1_i1:230-1123(-)
MVPPPKKVIEEKRVNLFESFVFGGIAGCIGATTVYPLDLVKTRLQTQRTVAGQVREYKGILDALPKIAAREGVRGLYKGLPAQLIGIAPEKATKLGVNDAVRRLLVTYNGDRDYYGLSILQSGLAGACAGFSHVVITNPYECVKIQMQLQGKLEPHLRKTMIEIVKGLGIKGLYQGASACFLRDIGFSFMYFAAYYKIRAGFRDENGNVPLGKQIYTGTMAGTVSSALATPADVLKTRLQAPGSTYKGLVDCAQQILRSEGPAALFKGVVPRMMIISPLFGITLFVYEGLMSIFRPK